jgi:hypothetical protein
MESNGMTKAKTVHIYPVEGASLPGVAAVEMDVDTETAIVLIATGAFTDAPPAEPVTEE